MHLKILADAMGLGKTVMTIALLLTHSERGGSTNSLSISQLSGEDMEGYDMSEQSPSLLKKESKFLGVDKLLKQNNTLINGGSLIVCPMTLLGQWKVSVLPLGCTLCAPAYLKMVTFTAMKKKLSSFLLLHSHVQCFWDSV